MDTHPVKGKWLPAGVAVALAAIACSGTSTSAAPPTRVCGKTLYNGALGLTSFDLWGKPGAVPPPAPGSEAVPLESAFPGVLLRVAPSCTKGAALVIEPPSALVIVNRVVARDGRPVAVSLQGGSAGPATLSATVGNSTQVIHFAVQK